MDSAQEAFERRMQLLGYELCVDPALLRQMQRVLDRTNAYVKAYRYAVDRLAKSNRPGVWPV